LVYQPGLVSVLIPLYNEEEFVGELLNRVLQAPLPAGLALEIVVVDDASRDRSPAIVEEIAAAHPERIRLIRKPLNEGKGAAIRTAIEHARGEFCLIQDADLEYDPRDYPPMLEPLVDGVADVVYGSRFLTHQRRRVLYYWHSVANHALTTLSNIVSNLNLTDMETCYKAFRTSLLASIPIRSQRFGIEPEITIKIAKRQARVYEVPIRYNGRTYEEGKKIGLKDAVQALGVILKYWIIDDLYKDPGAEILDAFSVAPRFNCWMADTIRPFLGQSVLEIGAGMGNLSRLLVRGRERYVATDIDDEHLGRLQNRLQHWSRLQTARCDLAGPADFTPFHSSLDTVVCLNVLEHIRDDLAGLRNIYSVLKAGGQAIVLVPHGQSLFGQLDVALGHHRRYSRGQFRNVIEQAGFQVETIIDFNRISRPGWFLNGRILRRSTISRTQLRVFDALVPLWRKIDSWLPWSSVSLIAVARRPS